VSALSDFLEYDRFDLINTGWSNEDLAGTETPGLQHSINKVIIFLSRKSRVNVSIVFNEGLFRDEPTLLMSAHALNKFSSHRLSLLFSCLASRVLLSLVSSLKLAPCDLTLTVLIK
jgi:hypothetical protein